MKKAFPCTMTIASDFILGLSRRSICERQTKKILVTLAFPENA